MSRLTERFGQNATTKEPVYVPAGIGKREGNPFGEIVDKLGRLEDLEEAGMVYEVFYFKPYKRWDICKRLAVITDPRDLGKTVFLTKEEAKAKIEELEGEYNG